MQSSTRACSRHAYRASMRVMNISEIIHDGAILRVDGSDSAKESALLSSIRIFDSVTELIYAVVNIKSRDIAIAHTASANIAFIRKYQRSGNSVYGYARALVMVPIAVTIREISSALIPRSSKSRNASSAPLCEWSTRFIRLPISCR